MRIQFLPDGSLFVLIIITKKVVIAGPREAHKTNLDSDQRTVSYACAPRL